MAARYIAHVTLTTGHSRRSPRSEVSDAAIDVCARLIAGFAAGQVSEPQPIPGAPGYSVSGRTGGRCMIATVWADGPPSELVVSIGVAEHERCGATIWRALHEVSHLPTMTSPDEQPRAPWCGVLIEPAIVAHQDAARWLGDFERCLAWAWLERRSP
jgi:hypothetical protein